MSLSLLAHDQTRSSPPYIIVHQRTALNHLPYVSVITLLMRMLYVQRSSIGCLLFLVRAVREQPL